jgi:nitric oxide reductase NorQ protein
LARVLVQIAERTRLLKGNGLDEGASTRMLINAGRLMKQGVDIEQACETTLVVPLTDDIEIRKALRDTISASIP